MIKSSVNILKQVIADKGFSWNEFAEYCGIGYKQLLDWLTCIYLPDMSTMRSVSQAIGLEEADIVVRVTEERQALYEWAKSIILQSDIGEVYSIRQIPGGRNFTFEVNGELILKVSCDELGESEQLIREKTIYELLLADHPEFPVAKLVSSGDFPTQWLIRHKINGLSLENLWSNMVHKQKCEVCFLIGQLMARFHDLPCENLYSNQYIPIYSSMDWKDFITDGISKVLQLLYESVQYDEFQIKELENFVTDHESILNFDFRYALLFGDHYDTHVYLTKRQDNYYIVGMFDFGSVMVGDPSWDFVYANISFLHRSPDYIVAFRKGYETVLPFPILLLEKLTLYTMCADQGIDVWFANQSPPDNATSMLVSAQEYWHCWL